MNRTDRVDVPRELQTLRGSLEALILDLARVATDEADASARQALSLLRHELDAALAALDVERARVSGLEQTVAQAEAAAQSERAAAAVRERDLIAARQDLETKWKGEEAAHANARREIEQAQVAFEAERAAVAQVRGTVVELERSLEASRAKVESTRTELESTRGELESTRGELEAARHQIDGMRRDVEAHANAASETQSELEQALRGAQEALRENDVRIAETMRERDQLLNQHDDLRKERDELQSERPQLANERDELRNERDTLRIERDVLRNERDELTNERADLTSELNAAAEAASAEDEALQSEHDERQRTRESQSQELQLAVREAETRAEAAERELALLRATTPAAGVSDAPSPVEPAARPPAKGTTPVTDTPAPEKPTSVREEYRGPARAAKRVAISGELDIQIDGVPAKLIDVSVTGAQILASASMKPNRLVRLTLPSGAQAIVCKAKIMWSRLEPRAGQIWYRAGVSFTASDQAARLLSTTGRIMNYKVRQLGIDWRRFKK